MLTAAGIDGLVASLQSELGSTEVESLYLSHEHASFNQRRDEELVSTLPRRLNVEDPTSTYVSVNEGYDDGTTQLWFYVSGASVTGYLTTDLDLEQVGRVFRAG